MINPANRELICAAPASEADDAEQAFEAAGQSFPEWSRMPMPKRAELLQRLLQEMRERETDFARTITSENGEPLREAHGEVQSAIKEVDFQLGMSQPLTSVWSLSCARSLRLDAQTPAASTRTRS